MIATLNVREMSETLAAGADGEAGQPIPILVVSGRLDASTVSVLERALLRAFVGDVKVVIIDMGEVIYISSSGLRVLLSSRRQARERGGDIILCNLSASVRDVFDMVGFTVLFKIKENLEHAKKEAQELTRS